MIFCTKSTIQKHRGLMRDFLLRDRELESSVLFQQQRGLRDRYRFMFFENKLVIILWIYYLTFKLLKKIINKIVVVYKE